MKFSTQIFNQNAQHFIITFAEQPEINVNFLLKLLTSRNCNYNYLKGNVGTCHKLFVRNRLTFGST